MPIMRVPVLGGCGDRKADCRDYRADGAERDQMLASARAWTRVSG